jgi:S-(hydroxymethyl)glutathione dehydrogenase/alcohol dehydrogenase
MKAAILTELRSPLVVADIDLPPDLSYGQVLVRVLVSGVCGSQLGEIDGIKGDDRFLPHLLGHEGCGDVMAIGSGVTTVKKGDRVVMHWRKGTGLESQTPQYKWGSKTVNAGWVTTFNEVAVVSENRLTSVAPDLDPEVAALMGCAVTTGLGVINNNAKLKIGQSIAVFGAGGVGLNIIQGAALVAANPIIAIDLYDHKLEMAKRFGATHTINSRNSDPAEEIQKIVGFGGVDVAVDNSGVVEVVQTAYEVTSPSGKTVLVGVPPKGQNIHIDSMPLHFSKVLTGSHGGEANPATDIPRYLGLYARGKIELKAMITHRYRLEEIEKALAEMRAGKVGRCMISMI